MIYFSGDIILADKGFPLIEEDVLGRKGFLVMPPFVRQKQQFSGPQNQDCYRIASVRIHVERAIARLKQFMVLQFLPHDLYKYINKILLILAFIVNNFNPLIADDEENESDGSESDGIDSDGNDHDDQSNEKESPHSTEAENVQAFLVFQK